MAAGGSVLFSDTSRRYINKHLNAKAKGSILIH